MAPLTAVQVGDYWVQGGGPWSRAVEWVAIAIGESALDDAAVSSAGAIGLWQIMPFNGPPYGYSPNDLFNPLVNARVAVAMSGGGTNCAAWDSCYADIGASGRYAYLSWPEQGSADFHNLAVAAAEIGGNVLDPAGDPGQPAAADPLPGTISALQAMAARQVPAATKTAGQLAAVIGRMYR